MPLGQREDTIGYELRSGITFALNVPLEQEPGTVPGTRVLRLLPGQMEP